MHSRSTAGTGGKKAGKSISPKKRSFPGEMIRLNRFIAASGICSRREADNLISSGQITVNGRVVTELGVKVRKDDDVRYRGKKLTPEKKVYILLNKPRGYVTTTSDPEGNPTVIDLIGSRCPERVFPVGRLDKNTTGVLLLTNDGDLAVKLMHPRYSKRKVYHVFLDRELTKKDLEELVKGVNIGDDTVAADAAAFPDENDRKQIGIEIHTGQNHVIKRMFESLGYKVKKLDRVYFAGLTKKNLPRGKWRFLTEKEINMLKRGIT